MVLYFSYLHLSFIGQMPNQLCSAEVIWDTLLYAFKPYPLVVPIGQILLR